MAGNGIADHGFEFLHRGRLSKDGIPQGAGFVATFWRFLDRKDDFTLRHADSPGRKYTPLMRPNQTEEKENSCCEREGRSRMGIVGTHPGCFRMSGKYRTYRREVCMSGKERT